MLLFQSNIAQNKDLIRQFCKDLRAKLYCEGKTDRISKLITENILESDIFKNAKNVMLFYPIKDEINLLGLLKSKDKNFYFPKCKGENLVVCPNCNDFTLNKYKIPEPSSQALDDLSILDIVFTPALCADTNFHRLGYGKGYYDRFFEEKKLRAIKIAPVSENFICQKLPHDNHDKQLDMIITELRYLTR